MRTDSQTLAAILTLGLAAISACDRKDTGTVTTTSTGSVDTAVSAAAVEERDNALIRVVHAVPGSGAVAIYAGDSLAFASVPYKTVTDFKEIGDDYFGFKVVPTGGTKESPIAENREKLEDGAHYTVVVFPDEGRDGKANVRVLNDELKPITDGKARVRMINAMANTDEVSMGVSGNDNKIFDDVNFKREAGWKEVDPMTGTFTFTTEGGKKLASKEGVTLAAGKNYTFVITGNRNKADLIMFEDAVAAAPSGS
jgi:hypothetical protein